MKAVFLVLAIAACGESKPPETPANTAEKTCAARAGELETYLAAVLDPSAKPAPPWPTGDAATDKRIDEGRAKVRKAMDPVDPSRKATQLSDGIKPGPLEAELAPCHPALDRLADVGRADTAEQKTNAFTGIADAIGTCGCNVNIPFVRAALYVLVRGPD